MKLKLNWLKTVVAVLVALPLLAAGAFLHYYLPSTDLIYVTGTETIRVNADGNTRFTTGPTRDLRLVYAERVNGGTARAFRNEDTGWGWPPYFKFNSGDIAAQATTLAQQRLHTEGQEEARPTVLATYYGWRLHLFSMYPNLVSLRVVEPGYTHIPVFNIVLLTLLALGIGWVTYRIRRWLRHRSAARLAETRGSGTS